MTEPNGTTNGKASPPTMNAEQWAELCARVDNMGITGRDFFKKFMDPRRDVDSECGYPSGSDLTCWLFKDLHDREPLANRVNQMLPKECWKNQPKVYEDEDGDTATDFEDDWDGLPKQLRGGSMYQDERGSAVFAEMEKVDVLSRIGHFGVTLMLFDDGKDLSTPVGDLIVNDSPLTQNELDHITTNAAKPQKGSWDFAQQRSREVEMPALNDGERLALRMTATRDKVHAVLNSNAPVQNKQSTVAEMFGPSSMGSWGTDAQYFGTFFGPSERGIKPAKEGKKLGLMGLRSFDETLVQVVRWEGNLSNPRFGQPNLYRITLHDPKMLQGGIGLPLATVMIHWTRVVHVADTFSNPSPSIVSAPPACEPVLNALLNVRKITGASGEGYWKGAFHGISIESDPKLGGDVKFDAAGLRDMVENYDNGLQRWMLLNGFTSKVLAPTVTDPKPHYDMQVELIALQIGCPVRVLKGSERGELASSQDDSDWNSRVFGRCNNYVTSMIIVRFIDRFILLGVMRPPKGDAKEKIGKAMDKVENAKAIRSRGCTLIVNAKTGQVAKAIADGGYSVEWPDPEALGDKDKAAILLQRTQAWAAYIAGGLESTIPPLEFATKFDDMDEEEAQAMLDAGEQHQEQQLADHADLATAGDPHDLTPTPPPGFEAKPPPPPVVPPAPIKVKEGERIVQPPVPKPTENVSYDEVLAALNEATV